MFNRLRGGLGWFVLTLGAFGSIAGCHEQTACQPPSAGLGQVVSWTKSERYQAEIDKKQGDVPHLACRAETTIKTMKAYIGESEDGVPEGKQAPPPGSFDQRLLPAASNIHTVEGEYRVLGLGHGVEMEDFGKAALQACDRGV